MSDFTKLRLRQLYLESCYLLRKYETRMPQAFLEKYSRDMRLRQYRRLELGTQPATVVSITDRR